MLDPKSVNLEFIIDLSIFSKSNVKKLSCIISLCNIPLLCKYDIPFEQSIYILIRILSSNCLHLNFFIIKSFKLPYFANSVTVHISFGRNTAQ